MLRVAIVGCGRIADAHASQIRRIDGCELVGVADREELMARQLHERSRAEGWFTDVGELLRDARPDVVHVTTPPESHFAIARKCLASGCHVYVEKPFTMDAREAEALIGLAGERGLLLTVGHDGQWSHAARRMRALVRAGYLGDRVVHMESAYGYDLGDVGYARAFLGDPDHWVRRLPGGLLQNVISHGIARIAEFLEGERPARVLAQGSSSPALRRAGGEGLVDELRVVVADEADRTAYFTFSSGMRPVLNQFRLFGSANGLVLDEHQQTVLKLRGQAFKSYAERFVPPVAFAAQYMGNAARSARLFLARDFHMEAGKHALITAFYRAIREGTPPPIPYREILLTAHVMDAVFDQVGGSPIPASAGRAAQC